MTDQKMDIFEFARARMNNKSVAMRVRNSPKLHAWRSAMKTKGSFASKGAGVLTTGLRLGLSQIPIPGIITDLLAVAQQAIEQRIRSHLHTHRSGPQTREQHVKFALKELSVEELDRYRWKLKDAYDTLNVKIAASDALYLQKLTEHKPCHAWLEVAEAFAQVERRYEILNDACTGLIATLAETKKWAKGIGGTLKKSKKDIAKKFGEVVDSELDTHDALEQKRTGSGDLEFTSRHEKCTDWCFYNNIRVDENETWASIKNKLALVARTIADPLDVETFAGGDYGGGGGGGEE